MEKKKSFCRFSTVGPHTHRIDARTQTRTETHNETRKSARAKKIQKSANKL